jgi:hypothetical protein
MNLPVLGESYLRTYGLNPQRPVAIDSSMLKDFVDCPSMFYLRHVLGLRRRIRSAGDVAKFDWGTCWHGAQEEYWKTRIAGADDHEARLVALPWINLNFPKGIRPDTDKHKRSKERMFKIFLEYLDTYVAQIDMEYETIRTEQFFDIFNEEFGLRWCGRLDKIRVKIRGGRVTVWDYKTTSAMSDSYFEGHEHGFQLPGYVWGASHLLTEPVQEVKLDVVYTLTASHKFFQRTFRYSPHRLSEWVSNVKRIADQIEELLAKHLYEPEAWVKNWNECTRYGRCTFSDVHFTAPTEDTRLRILENDYIEDRWDPSAHADEQVA